jgi:hypothetical protein
VREYRIKVRRRQERLGETRKAAEAREAGDTWVTGRLRLQGTPGS